MLKLGDKVLPAPSIGPEKKSGTVVAIFNTPANRDSEPWYGIEWEGIVHKNAFTIPPNIARPEKFTWEYERFLIPSGGLTAAVMAYLDKELR